MKKWFAACMVLSFAFTAGCSDSDGDGSTGGDGDGDGDGDVAEARVELVSWWTNEADAAALQTLIEAYKDDVPNGVVVNLAEDWDSGVMIREETLGQPDSPDVLQTFPSLMQSWYAYGDASENILFPLDDVLSSDELAGFDQGFLDALTHEGKLYGLPIAVHRLNSLFFSQEVFDEYDKEPPANFDEFLTLAAEMKDLGAPFAVSLPNHGSKEFFNWMVVETQGAQYLADMMHGKLEWEGDDVEASVDAALDQAMEVLDLSVVVGAGAGSQDAEDALDDMLDGKISMFLYPDWMKAWMIGQGKEPGVDFGLMTAPTTSSDKIFTAVVDAIVISKDAKNLDNAQAFVKSSAAKSTITEFVAAKQCNSARTDLDADSLDPIAAAALEELNSAAIVNLDATTASSTYNEGIMNEGLASTFVLDYTTGACEPAACKATFIDGFKTLLEDVNSQ